MSTDKALMKDILNNFSVELQASSENEHDKQAVREVLNRAGGANKDKVLVTLFE